MRFSPGKIEHSNRFCFRNCLHSSHFVNDCFVFLYLLFVDRMGATDNIYKGQSTFMVELQVNLNYLICAVTVF